MSVYCRCARLKMVDLSRDFLYSEREGDTGVVVKYGEGLCNKVS